MRSRDERADNLILRLFSYSPRPERQPLEDYWTEALAWCLRSSAGCLREFLRLAGLSSLCTRRDSPSIDTQMPFSANGDENHEIDTGGRFDLVIQFGLPTPVVLVVETKVGIGSRFENQLENYRDELNKSDAFEGVPLNSRYLGTLTTLPYRSEFARCGLTWPQIHAAIDESQQIETDQFVAKVLEQFGAFLKEKGLAMLKLRKTSGNLLSRWSEVKHFENELRQMLERLRNQEEIKPMVGRRKLESNDIWTGVNGKNSFWAGFGILDAELFLQVEITVQGDQRKRRKGFAGEMAAAFDNAKRYHNRWPEELVNFGNLTKQRNSKFVFTKAVEGKLDGDGEAAFEWLYRMARKAIGLAAQ